jgi:hypothetical protein
MKKTQFMKKPIRKIGFLTAIAFALFAIQSCNKDEYEVINNGEAIPTGQALKNLFDGKLASISNVQLFQANTTLNWTSPRGVQLTINGSTLRKNGNPVVGEVKVLYTEIFDKGNMLTTNKPTMGIVAGEQQLLVSGGEFNIVATQDGVPLTVTSPYSLVIPTSLTGGTQTGMLPFVGTIATDGNLTWSQPLTLYELITNTGNPPASTGNYSALLSGFGWFNCDRFYNATGPKTTITANVPAGYGSSSALFLAVKSIPNSLGSTGGQFPVGLDCHLIFVTTKDGKFRYAIKPQILTAGHTVTFSLSETILGTPAELTTAINALP